MAVVEHAQKVFVGLVVLTLFSCSYIYMENLRAEVLHHGLQRHRELKSLLKGRNTGHQVQTTPEEIEDLDEAGTDAPRSREPPQREDTFYLKRVGSTVYLKNRADKQQQPIKAFDKVVSVKRPEAPAHMFVGDGRRYRLPKALIIGAAKCGTAALDTFLTLNPDIIKPPGETKELHFFNTEYYLVNGGLRNYMQSIPPHYEHQIGIERTPQYLYYPNDTPGRIRQVNSTMKLIAVLCDPTNRLISKYAQLKYRHGPKTPAFNMLYLQRGRHGETQVHGTQEDVERGIYSKWFQLWLKYFPLEQFHIVDGDMFKVDPVSELQAVERFLGLESKISNFNLYFDEQKGFFCMNIDGERSCMGEKKGRHHPYVSSDVINLLRDFYRPHNKKLTEVIQKELNFTRY